MTENYCSRGKTDGIEWRSRNESKTQSYSRTQVAPHPGSGTKLRRHRRDGRFPLHIPVYGSFLVLLWRNCGGRHTDFPLWETPHSDGESLTRRRSSSLFITEKIWEMKLYAQLQIKIRKFDTLYLAKMVRGRLAFKLRRRQNAGAVCGRKRRVAGWGKKSGCS